nr:exodeoxyribonuclease VII large subunit [Synergistales bacterium]
KRPLPDFPVKAAVITSSTGAALRDVLKVARLRFPLCRFILIPTLVQGLEAPDQLVRSIQALRKIPELEVAFLVRGGGSRDDLNPFDDERVVRAVRLASVPMITGLGHQVDLTLCDLAADHYASTPSAAVERVLPDQKEIYRILEDMNVRARSQADSRIRQVRSELKKDLKYLENIVNDRIRKLGMKTVFFRKSLSMLAAKTISDHNRVVTSAEASLNSLSPLSVLQRGFITCEDPVSGEPVSNVSLLRINEEYILHFRNGNAIAQILDVHLKDKDLEV